MPEPCGVVPGSRGGGTVAGMEPTPTGGAASSPVDEAVRRRLAGLQERPPEEHVAAYEDVQRLLQEALAGLDEV